MNIKKWTPFKKTMGVISAFVVVFSIYVLINTIIGVNSRRYDSMGLVLIPFIIMILIGLGILWSLTFWINNLIKKKKFKLAYTITILGLAIFSLLFLFLFIGNLISPYGIPSLMIGAVLFQLGIPLIPAIYFAIMVRIIYKAKNN